METEQWTITNALGEFSFEKISLNHFTIEIHHLGKSAFHHTYSLKEIGEKTLTIELTSENYDINEVVVTAEKGHGITTTSTIDNVAIQHVQPTTLGDVMQLLPGGLIDNPDLSKKQNIAIREIDTDANSASGTAIIVDGAPISNDANYQTLSTTKITTELSTVSNANLGANNSIGSGVDLRQIGTDNIESIEVIQGIPSVQYGNLTSGAVIVKTKSGYTPYEVKIKSDPKLKQFYVGKGAKLNDGSAINANVEYTNSFKDLVSRYEGFNRLSGQLAYSNTFLRHTSPLSFNTKLSFHHILDEKRTDPDALEEEEVLSSSETGTRLNIYGRWSLNKRFITNLNYNISSSVKQQEDYKTAYRSGSTEAISISKEEGENEGHYIKLDQLSELTIKGLPVDVFAQISGNKNYSFDNDIVNNTLVGFDYRFSGNYGEGSLYDITNPPVTSSRSASTRPRAFSDIPASSTVAFFAENKTTLPIGNTVLDIQAGIRVNNFQPTGITKGDIGVYAEPRLNIRFKLINDKAQLVNKLNLHGGVGVNYKSPSLLYLYPDLAYFDIVSLDHFDSDPNVAMAYFTTRIFDTSNPNLKPAKNLKQEIGFEFGIGKVTGDITAYKEQLTDGLGMIRQYHFIDYKKYDGSSIPPNTKPDIEMLDHTDETFITWHSMPTNNKASDKLGVEYTFNFGKIKPLHTTVMMNGAWMKTTRIHSTSTLSEMPQKDAQGQFSEIAVYPSGAGNVSERMNTTFRFITHSPRLRLVFTTTLQVTWIDKRQVTDYEKTPLYLYSKEENYIPFTDEMREDNAYKDYTTTYGVNTFIEESLPPLLLCNFKLSKEISDRVKFSFYANNFVNNRPIYQSEKTYNYTKRNPSIYFGAELNITL